MIVSMLIYDPDMNRKYELDFCVSKLQDAWTAAELKVKPWGHVVRGFGTSNKVEGSRV
jgi:hypothetical protein